MFVKTPVGGFFALLLSVCLASAPALAQPRGMGHPPPGGERQNGMRSPYNSFDSQQNVFTPRNDGFEERRQRLSPEERRELRRDIRDAGRELYRPRR